MPGDNTMLYPSAPVATSTKHQHPLTMSSNPSSTAFPFPPPLYLSTLNSLIQSSTSPVAGGGVGLLPAQAMSTLPWALHSPSISPHQPPQPSPSAHLHPFANKILGDLKHFSSKNSDNNNNELNLSITTGSGDGGGVGGSFKKTSTASGCVQNISSTKSSKEEASDNTSWPVETSESMSSYDNDDVIAQQHHHNKLPTNNKLADFLSDKERAQEVAGNNNPSNGGGNTMLFKASATSSSCCSTTNATSSPFLLPQFNGSGSCGSSNSSSSSSSVSNGNMSGGGGVSSPTFPLAMSSRLQGSPAHVYGPSYPYMLPPNLYYYHGQQQQQQQPGPQQSAYSPTNHTAASPISPFLVPNMPRPVSPSLISAAHNNGATSSSLFDAYRSQTTLNHHHHQHNLHPSEANHDSLLMKHKSHSAIDLAIGGRNAPDTECSSPYKQTLSPGSFHFDKMKLEVSGVNSLKRKNSPIDENEEGDGRRTSETLSPAEDRPTGSPSSQASGEPSSRKHRILKPPNINISDCDYRHSFTSAFLPSPLFHYGGSNAAAAAVAAAAAAHPGLSSALSSHYPSSSYHDTHVPLSAPPIPPSNASRCFDFPAPPDKFVFTPPSSRPQTSSSSLGQQQQQHQQQHQQQDRPTSLNSLLATGAFKTNEANKTCLSKAESLSSILKDKKKKCLLNGQHHTGGESKVTFQVPQPVGKTSENQENRYNRKAGHPLGKDKAQHCPTNGNNAVRRHQPYPEYFRRGSTIELGNGSLKKVEELSTEDFIQSASLNGKLKVELSEVLLIKENVKKGLVRIDFLVGQARVRVSLDSPPEHPYYVYQKGWSSYSPSLAAKRYGLNCHRLSLGDIIVTLANKTTATTGSNQTKPMSRSLASSTGSLSSTSSTSSSSLANCSTPTMLTTTSNVFKAHSKPSSGLPTVSISASCCPPPAHANETSHKNLLQSSITETALNLNFKCNNISTNSKADCLKDSADNDDEEIDVEKVDDL